MFDLEFIHVDVYVGVKIHVGGNVGVKTCGCGCDVGLKTHVGGVKVYVKGVKTHVGGVNMLEV